MLLTVFYYESKKILSLFVFNTNPLCLNSLTLYAKNYYIFVSGGRSKAWCLARTTVQKDGDFLITGHIGFDSRVPNLKV